jgi:hypothetical protein
VVTVENGLLTGIAAGGPVTVSATHNGVTDNAVITIWPKPSFIKRINFQVDAAPFSYGWLADNGQAFDGSRGYGWSARQSTTRDDRGGNNFLLKSLVNAGSSGAQWTLAVPTAGEYILKIGMGDNQYGSTTDYSYTIHGTDTLVRHIGRTNTIAVDTVTVSGNALVLTVTGAINYIVVISNEGIDVNTVADDGGVSVPGAIEDGGRLARLEGPALTTRPNPFNPAIKIAVSGQRIADGNIGIAIYNIDGKIVYRLSATSYQLSAGITWNATGHPSGVYIIRATVNGQVLTRRIVLQK